jgi:hypothetical protein
MSEIANLAIREQAAKTFSHYKLQLSSSHELRGEFKKSYERVTKEGRVMLFWDVVRVVTSISIFTYLFISVIRG